tara:strand:- start:1314 stop:1727 length:414 start_codon:yes stop_codon:yes gene_type:complete
MTSMGKRFSCDSLRVRNTISCSAETGLSSPAGATTAAEVLNLTEVQLADNLMFLYALRAPNTPTPKQTLTINLPTSNFLATLNVYVTATSQDAGQTTAEEVSIRRVTSSQYVLTRTPADGSNITAISYVELMLMTYD